MNYIVKKSDNTVVWINPDPTKLTGENAWSGFNDSKHKIVFAQNYNPEIGQEFNAEIDSNGVAKEFEIKKVWNKDTLQERTLWNWDDEIDSEKETDKEPLTDIIEGQKFYKRFQKFENGNWVVDTVAEKEAKVPETLTPAQGELALLEFDLLDQAVALVNDPKTPEEIKIMFRRASYWARKDERLIALASKLGLNSAEIDDLFIVGSKKNI